MTEHRTNFDWLRAHVNHEGEECLFWPFGIIQKFRKCGLNRAKWTHGPGSDIRAGSPACSKWEDATK